MQPGTPEPKGKLDAMTGYSFSTPVWDGRAWARPEVAGGRVTARIVNGPEDQHRNEPAQWEKIDWRGQEEQVRRLRQRIFKASQEGDWPKPRSTDAFPGLSVFKQVSALIGAVDGCTW